jgi:hypothetical protein
MGPRNFALFGTVTLIPLCRIPIELSFTDEEGEQGLGRGKIGIPNAQRVEVLINKGILPCDQLLTGDVRKIIASHMAHHAAKGAGPSLDGLGRELGSLLVDAPTMLEGQGRGGARIGVWGAGVQVRKRSAIGSGR